MSKDNLPFEANGPHDVGGHLKTFADPINVAEHDYAYWERRVDAMSRLLMRKGYLQDFAEVRAGIESLTPDDYHRLGYYERWAKAFRRLLVNKGILTSEEVDAKIAALQAAEGTPGHGGVAGGEGTPG